MSHRTTEDPATIRAVATELEALRLHDAETRNDIHSDGAPFPRSCRRLLRSIPGNSRCMDCGNRNPDWASVTYGVLLCTVCSGRHRSYGVSVSRVRSVTMDSWSHSQVLAMLEGGNEQLQNFYSRHGMGERSPPGVFGQRYHTKAARFYRQNMEGHVAGVGRAGRLWRGREASRNAATLAAGTVATKTKTKTTAPKPLQRTRSTSRVQGMAPVVALPLRV
mmetsp:Transcript_15441/g.35379  ORF Transcript_15441/g.35379 Transcript_15441/m.35379 type:complete len:220 (-) Transcript_15441:583-1242(-)|eukprot:CAMPEP_0201115906 /NCGR_PEP_ID=MMETSP0850-20130426/317_1 /ASSEMBLY_ACC=CAM_ASM_000622 /TAXON_ID=183588 /ORGANISM="Pseudo-nitzschia fraudulenta, Strain WWA7" /LENGTH=219 /DNA_ID=CAMNT_0047379823 /DNA_START=168 /DNA_END=827 /DNA_ORIENTATION=-